jgi:peptidoglycan-associated lipoprotein
MNAFARLAVATSFACSLLLLAGCGPKPVAPYTPQGNMPEGAASEYAKKGAITEDIGPYEEGLDAAGRSGQNVGSFGLNGDQASDAYKREHGRSSKEMKPIYFDFDQSTIRGDQIPSMEHNATYLKSSSTSSVLVEGNTDERGTNEYNLALGERRAQSAKKYLIEYGIDSGRIRTVSYGEERPLFTGQSEDDYALNRRDDFILE